MKKQRLFKSCENELNDERWDVSARMDSLMLVLLRLRVTEERTPHAGMRLIGTLRDVEAALGCLCS